MRRLLFRTHSIRRMFERGISEAAVREVVLHGETIEEYPDDEPYPSRLILGFDGARPIHVVTADAPDELTIIITVYEPDPERWGTDFRRRRTS